MWWIKAFIATAFLAGALFGALFVLGADDRALAATSASCAEFEDHPKKIECWLALIDTYISNGDMDAAVDAFGYIYERYPAFSASGCHRYAHAVGDSAYYHLYVTRGLTLDTMEFPQGTTACGYGFFHGFVEHLIQDDPDASFAVESCEKLRERLGERMRDIGTICYHASGHGFLQSSVDTMQKAEWGNVHRAVERPLSLCEKLERASDDEKRDCREGVFNVMADWMVVGDFGFSFNYEDPFAVCRSFYGKARAACYYEFAQVLESFIDRDPGKIEKYVQSIEDGETRGSVFGVVIAGLMAREAPLGTYPLVFEGCFDVVSDKLFQRCISSSVHGMMEHGTPGSEYEKPLEMCMRDGMDRRGARDMCFTSLFRKLARFYEPEKKASICRMVPAERVETCVATP